MLVLTRKPGEQVIIADNIRITVVAVGPGRVKIGIEAPPDVKIDRQEIHDKKQAEQTPSPEAAPTPVIVTPLASAVPTTHNRLAGKIALEAVPASVGGGEDRVRRIGRRFPPRKPR